MAMWQEAQETKATSFTAQLGRDLVVLAGGLATAAGLAAVGMWAVQPASLLTGWNSGVALWALAPALALLVAHWQAAKAWTGSATVPGVDSRATTLAAFMLAPAVLVLSASVVASVAGMLGGPTHPNLVADDLTSGGHLVRAVVGVSASALVVLAARLAMKRR